VSDSRIIERILREAGDGDILSALSQRLSATDLQSLLLEVYRARSRETSPAELLAEYERNRFVRPSDLPSTALLKWESIAFSRLPPEFAPIELSPVCPLGTCSVVATVDQNKSVATIRNTEVVSDSTNALALECASRRRKLLRADPRSAGQVHLAARARLLRAQSYDERKFRAHFAAFALCSAGRDQGNLSFELSALGTQLSFCIGALREYLGPEVELWVEVTDLSGGSRKRLVEERLFTRLRDERPGLELRFDDERSGGRNYYIDFCFHLCAKSERWGRLELGDGGCVDWTRKLLGNAKERLVTSGLGSELLCMNFGELRSPGRSPSAS
jgi:hypothetical protein